MISEYDKPVLKEMRAPSAAARFPAFSPKAQLCGIAYSCGTIDDFQRDISKWLRGDRSAGVVVSYVNPHVFNLAKKHDCVRELLDKADIVSVDGVGFAVAAWLRNGRRQSRTVMTPLFDRVLEDADLPRLPAVLLGGSGEASKKGAAGINRLSRNMQVTAAIDGYQPLPRYIDFLREHSTVDVILVGMGTPRSEELILEASAMFPGKLFWNIGGGTLQFYAGTLLRVPKIVSKLCLQWFWRMLFEPRLVPRYVIGLPVFAGHLLRTQPAHK